MNAALLPKLTVELRVLLIDLLDAAKTFVVLHDDSRLVDLLESLTEEQFLDLEVEFDHFDLHDMFQSPDAFIEGLESIHLAPLQYISPEYILRECRETALKTTIISDLLIDDLITRLTDYLYHTPVLIRIGIYQSWLRCEATGAQALADVIRGSNAPLLQKLVQMIGEASYAKEELQVIKHDVQPMTTAELQKVLADAQVSFESFDMTSVAAGSIGQGHYAELNGPVFVKSKRLGIADVMREEARIFNLSSEVSGPWADLATELIKETSFTQELDNQRILASGWSDNEGIKVVNIIAAYPETDPSILIMARAPGTVIGASSIRFPLGLQNAVSVFNKLIHHFYLSTLFAEDTGYAPGDPHSSNFQIHCCPTTAAVTLTILDTASICTITKDQRTVVINLLICIMMSDARGICVNLEVDDDAFYLYREILSRTSDDGMDQWVLKTLIKIIEATKLILKRPALNDLLSFGKAQLQLLDTVSLFTSIHQKEMTSLNLSINSPLQTFKALVSSSDRRIIKDVLWSATESSGRLMSSFTPWDTR